ncbi:MAG TPA: FkbM family methyltransferase [Lachnospiraceae bacterium]|nr:FkbM family methyltransferase [Lachnospiraceae bacterium]
MGKVTRFLAKKLFGAGKVKGQKFWYNIYQLSLFGMNIGRGSDLESSGETFIMQYIHEHIVNSEHPVLFDAGANVGEYTLNLLHYFDHASIHSFEPAQETYRTLCQNVKSPNVCLINAGLSDKCSEQTLFYDEANSKLASLYNRQLDYFGIHYSKSETVSLDTIDHYCQERGISQIDFLKIDVEGNELKVLLGAQQMISSGCIHAIQIEFGGTNIDSRTYFRDFWNMLHERFHVYRIVCDGLYEIDSYTELLEIFTCTNYLFIKR